jgi:hypothetical protein
MFIILISYRSREPQTFRRKQLIKAIDNFKKFFEKNEIEYKIIISEQNNNKKFNRGLLLNAAFLECEKKFTFPKKYIHMNVDYTFDLSRKFPKKILDFEKGFMELFRPDCPELLGSACVFDQESYRKINGFPNDLYGWGGDDWAIYSRIMRKNISIFTPEGLCNSGFIIEDNEDNSVIHKDCSMNDKNINLSKRNDSESNGLTTIIYNVSGFGEFHDENVVFHYLIRFNRNNNHNNNHNNDNNNNNDKI